MKRFRRGLTAAAVAACAIVGSTATNPSTATAQTSGCDVASDYCAGDEITLPGAPGAPAPSGGDGQATPVGAAGAPSCTWSRNPGIIGGGDSPGAIPDVGVRPSDDAYLIFEICDGEPSGRLQWATPGTGPDAEPPAPVITPAQLAATIRVRLEGNLPQPVLATSPPVGEAAVVNHPTFLAVDNWIDTITDEECAFLLCVTVTATPTLTWSPGEPGSGTLACTGGGTRFDPGQGTPQAQAAAPGACAHPYRTRTAAAGRPTEWTGQATITWTLTWASTTGVTGTLPSIVRTADTPRAVEEVQAVVVR